MVLGFFGKRYRSFLEKLVKHCSNEGWLDGSTVQIGGKFFFSQLFLGGIITCNEIRIIVFDEIQTFASYLSIVQSRVRHAVGPCPELCGVLSHLDGVCPQCLTILPQCGTDYAHFLEGLLQQIGHLHKGLLLGETGDCSMEPWLVRAMPSTFFG